MERMPAPSGCWEMVLQLDAVCPMQATIKGNNAPVLEWCIAEECVCVTVHTQWHCTTARFGQEPAFEWKLKAPLGAGQYKLVWLGYLCQLYQNDQLMDEEWPLGEVCGGEWLVEHNEGVMACVIRPTKENGAHAPKTMTFQSSEFALSQQNTYVGDCMPFSRDGSYCLYYLFDRKHHGSKQRLGAHQWAQMTSADLKTWVLQPLALPITEQWEGSICTGSLLQEGQTTYAFYAVRMADGSPAKLSWAVSKDGVHFEKSGRYFTLTAPYEPVSARDPMVFKGADGQYHMLVTTSLVDGGTYGGCLAHLTSTNLENWIQREPFIVPGYADQPECSDYFCWNGWYYLVFSNFATARYRMSRSPFGPWIRPAFDELDAHDIHVPKTAAFGARRLMTGFLSTQRYLYAGTAITHELFQRDDGTLGATHVQELLPDFAVKTDLADAVLDAGNGRTEVTLTSMTGNLRLTGRLICRTLGTAAGLQIHLGEDQKCYQLAFDPASGHVRLMDPGCVNPTGEGRMPISVSGVEKGLDFDLLLHGDVMDVAFADGRMITCRLPGSVQKGVTVMVYAQAGNAAFCKGQLYTNEKEKK